MIKLSESWGVGGTDPSLPHDNCVSRSWAAQVDGVWQVSTWIPDVTTSRPATDAEAAGFEAHLNPAPAPVNPVEQVAVAVTTAIDAAPNTIAGVKSAIKTSLGQFIS